MNTSFSIVKAFAIIAVVVYHCCSVPYVGSFLGLFMIPAFFICSGYFFKASAVSEPASFVGRRLRRLYVPFVKWSLVLLVLHNVFFSLGIYNETVGSSASGGVLHPYTWHQFCQRLWSIVLNMSGYDEFLGGTFWFFRALLLASVAFLGGQWLLRRLLPDISERQIGWSIFGTALALGIWKQAEGITATGVAQGGYREICGILFMSIGYLYRLYEAQIARFRTWPFAIAALGVLIAVTAVSPVSMTISAKWWQLLLLTLTGSVGFFALHYVSLLADKAATGLKKSLVFIGNNSLYIFAFHFAAFKLVSMLKISLLGLSWVELGAHPVIHGATPTDFFWLLYALVGIAVPLGIHELYVRYVPSVDIDYRKVAWFTFRFARRAAKVVARAAALFFRALGKAVGGFFRDLKAIAKAANPNNEDE